MNATDDDRIAKLPVWARDMIKRLERANEPMIEEIVRLRRRNEVAEDKARNLSGANEALMEILRCAGRGGSDWAAAVVSVLEGYEIFKHEE